MKDNCFPHLLLALGAAVSLASCAGSSDKYPSLAIRDAERVEGSFAVAEPSGDNAPSPLDPATLQGLDQLVASAASAHAAFMGASPSTERLVAAAAGAPVESNRWAEAQVALADLDSQRSEAAIALGDLDLLYADASTSFERRAEIAAAREEVVALIAQEDAVLAQLRATMAR